jgi:hypothetical protein
MRATIGKTRANLELLASPPMESRLLLSLAAAPFVFAVSAVATRAPWPRIGGALAGGVVFALGNAGWDALALAAGWWSYPGASGSHGPWLWYAAAGLSGGGVSLIGWRVRRRFGLAGALVFLVAFAAWCVVRDWRVAHAPESVIVFAPGMLPYLADAAAALTLMALALGVQLALGGDPKRLR